MDNINQKEYLKKYLGFGKLPGEKKRKKKLKGISNRVTIIDDDVETFTSIVIEEDPLLASEDAPQIVAIIDERPPSLRVDEKTKNPLWQPIGTTETINSGEQKQMITGFKIAPKSDDKPFVRPADRSPPRRRRIHTSPPRKSKTEDPVKKMTGNEESSSKYKTASFSPPRTSRHDDNTPPRMVKNDDYSPPRRSRSDDYSPPRRSRNYESSPRKPKRGNKSSPQKSESGDHTPGSSINNGDDVSPLRRKPASEYNSPPRKIKRDKSKDISPPRRRSDGDNSPRKAKKNHAKDDISPPRRSVSVSSMSPSRRSRGYDSKHRKSPPRKSVSKTRDFSPARKQDLKKKQDETMSAKMEKTLDGKTAGLQNAEQLVEETEQFRHREDQLFKHLPQEVSGQNAETVFRDRKSGKIRNLAEEEGKQQKNREEEQKNKEKYSRWGRGLVQVENRDQRIKDELYEMSKPLARYADDEDLEKYLKEQEREGDPMLAYIRSKRRKKAAEKGVAQKPEFEGEFMPNRFGIRPGHRWDGVDRSNGYEKKWFEVQNARRAQQEDIYKWSTEDM